jgi:hypothetical protein
MLQQINLAILTMWDGFKSLARGALVAPVACYALAQALYLALIVNFHLPLWSGMLSPLLRRIGGGAAVHYPQLFLALPNIFDVGNLVLGATIGAYLWGVAVFAVANRVSGHRGSPWRVAAARFPQLFVAQLPVVAAALAVFFLPGLLLGDADVGGMTKRLLLYGPILFGILVESLFLFAPMAVVIERRNPFSAIGRSLEIWRGYPVAALLVVGVSTAVHMPVMWALARVGTIMTRVSPETVLIVLGGDVLLGLVTNVILVVAATLVYYDMLGSEA